MVNFSEESLNSHNQIVFFQIDVEMVEDRACFSSYKQDIFQPLCNLYKLKRRRSVC